MVSTEQDGAVERLLRLEVRLAASRSKVWAALVAREDLGHWLGQVDGELEVGGSFAVKNNASGDIHGCAAEALLELDWNYGDSKSSLRVELEDAGSDTMLTLTNSGSGSATEDEHWLTYGPGAGGVGWEITLFGLEHYLATGQALDEERWVGTEAATALVRGSSLAWAELHSAIGADVETSRRAAENTANFYLGLG